MCAEIQIVNINGHQGGAEYFLRGKNFGFSIFECSCKDLTKDMLMAAVDCEGVSLSSMLEPQCKTGKSWRYGSLVAAVIVPLVDCHRTPMTIHQSMIGRREGHGATKGLLVSWGPTYSQLRSQRRDFVN